MHWKLNAKKQSTRDSKRKMNFFKEKYQKQKG